MEFQVLHRRFKPIAGGQLQGIQPGSLTKQAAEVKAFGRSLVDHSREHPEEDMAESLANYLIGAALTLLLIQRGGTLSTAPGQDISVTLGIQIEPFSLLQSLQSGKVTAETWTAQCAELGITGRDLGKVILPPSAIDPDQRRQPAAD